MDDARLPDTVAQALADDAPPRRGKAAAFFGLGLLLAAAGGAGGWYFLSTLHTVATEDAFVDGHISQVSPQIGGRVVAVLVEDNQAVSAGQRLVDIDPRDFQVRLDQAQAQRAQAEAEVAQARATHGVRRADIGQAEANIRVAEADLFQAQQDLARYRAINPRAITRQQLDNATAAVRSAQARLEASRHGAEALRAQLSVAAAQITASEAALRTAEANVTNTKLQLSYTHVLAPAGGRVTRRTVELGNYINPGQALFAIVQPGLWVTANFKETQLTDMHPGQTARLHVDAYPNAALTGHVDSWQSGTGAVFSVLPTENATGNWVKVVQRVPVKILFDGDAALQMAISPGMSVNVRVDLR